MKRAFKILFVATFLFALLVIPGDVALAALVKTTSLDIINDWTMVSATEIGVGNAENISGCYRSLICLEIVYNDDGDSAQSGVDIIVEASYGDDDWMYVYSFVTPAASANDTFLASEATEGATAWDLNDASGLSRGDLVWIEDTVFDESEVVRVKSEAGDTIQLCHEATDSHDINERVLFSVFTYLLPVPPAFAYVRVLINNTDLDSDVSYTTRLLKVTEL